MNAVLGVPISARIPVRRRWHNACVFTLGTVFIYLFIFIQIVVLQLIELENTVRIYVSITT